MIAAFFAKWGAKLLAGFVAVAAILGGLGMYGRSKKAQGTAEAKAKATEKVLENVEKAKRATDRLRSDPSERDKLRSKRTRD